MFHTVIPRKRNKSAGGIAAALLVLVASASASAQSIQSFPGSSCQATGSAQDLTYGSSGILIANRQDSRNSAACPVVRSNVTQGWTQLAIVVRDRHSTDDVTCTAQVRDLTGSAGTGWSNTKSSSGEGIQALVFDAPAPGDVPELGPYAIVCSLPAMEEVNQPSYIASYIIVEP